MQPTDDRSAELMQPGPHTAARTDDTVAMPHVSPRATVAQTVVVPPPAVPAELSGMLLPSEYVTFASAPHPIIMLQPVIEAIVVVVALVVALSWQTHPIVRGHHQTIPLLTGLARSGVLIFGGLILLREAASFLQRLFHYLAFRIVSTNRRVFVVQGFFGRRVTPVGNTALAGATMSQSILGRMLDYGDVVMPLASSGPGLVRTMREPVRLYRELEAVANGVDGDTWQPAIRQTLIP
ncbi:MAG TPA: PH domain-containing protein [Candidatus Elarobacter sp.]|jgi:hypothetical protein